MSSVNYDRCTGRGWARLGLKTVLCTALLLQDAEDCHGSGTSTL